MKRALLLAIALVAVSAAAEGQTLVLWSEGVNCAGTLPVASNPIAIGGVKQWNSQIWSTAGSVCTIQLQYRSSASAPWVPAKTFADPTAAGTCSYDTVSGSCHFINPRSFEARFVITAGSSGIVWVNVERFF